MYFVVWEEKGEANKKLKQRNRNNSPEEPGRRKMLENELVILFRLVSFRLNGSYDELGVSCIGVVCDRLEVMELPVPPPPFESLGPPGPDPPRTTFDSMAFLRMLMSRNSRSTRKERATSTISSDSSHSGSSASICCLRIFRTWQRVKADMV